MNVVITGGSKGIGKAIAEKFASEGYSLFLCARNGPLLEETANELKKKYPLVQVNVRSCDVSDKTDLKSFADWVIGYTSSVDVLVNNAGTFFPGNVYEEEDGKLEKMIETNLYSAYYLSRYLLPQMINRRSGHIFNMCSIASLQAYNNGGSYGISKYALAGLSANLRHEMKEFGIKVTAVYPGAIYTDSWAGSGLAPDRLMTVSDIAELIYTSARLSPQACVEEIVIRPQLGDL